MVLYSFWTCWREISGDRVALFIKQKHCRTVSAVLPLPQIVPQNLTAIMASKYWPDPRLSIVGWFVTCLQLMGVISWVRKQFSHKLLIYLSLRRVQGLLHTYDCFIRSESHVNDQVNWYDSNSILYYFFCQLNVLKLFHWNGLYLFFERIPAMH